MNFSYADVRTVISRKDERNIAGTTALLTSQSRREEFTRRTSGSRCIKDRQQRDHHGRAIAQAVTTMV